MYERMLNKLKEPSITEIHFGIRKVLKRYGFKND